MTFQEESGGSTAVPASWGKKMNNKFGIKKAPNWWSKELAIWTNNQRTFGKAFKKPTSQRSSAEKTYAGQTTKCHVALLDGIGFDWEPQETDWAKLLAQLVVFKEESRGCTTVPERWGPKIQAKFGVEQAPDWWSEELGALASQQRKFGKAFKKPASQRSSAEKTYAGQTTKCRVALLDCIGFFT